MELSDYPQCSRWLVKCQTSLNACLTALGVDLKRLRPTRENPLALHAGYLDGSLDDYDPKSLESAILVARLAQDGIEDALERGDIDSFAYNLSRLTRTVADLSALVARRDEHAAHKKVREGHLNRAKATAKTTFQNWVRNGKIRVRQIGEVFDLPGCPVTEGEHVTGTLRDWYREIYPDQLQGGRPKGK